MADAFKTLESAHEEVLIAMDEAHIETEETYLDSLADDLSAMDVKVNTSLQTQNAQQAQEKAIADTAAQKRAFEGAVGVSRRPVSLQRTEKLRRTNVFTALFTKIHLERPALAGRVLP